MKKKKLTTKIEFEFDIQEDLIEFDVDMNIKKRKKIKTTLITNHITKKKDPSTKLF